MYLDPRKQAMADLGIEDFSPDESENVYLEGKQLMEFIRKGKIAAKHEHEAVVKERKSKIDQEKLANIERAIEMFDSKENEDNQTKPKIRQLRIKELPKISSNRKPSGPLLNRKSSVSPSLPIPEKTPKKLQTLLGFNTKQARFLTIGLHPKLDSTGCLKHFPNISPANYVPTLKPPRNGFPDWTNALRTQVFSKTLGYQVPGLLKERKWRRSLLGPAWYSLQGPKSPEEGGDSPGVVWSKTERFPKPERHPVPGPGAHNIRSPVKRGTTSLPSFEWSAAVDRCAYSRKSFHLPPNIYTIKTPYSIAIRTHPDVKVSRRGPYDLFTGPRDDSTLYGHWAPSKFKGCKGWPFDAPSLLRSNDMQPGKFSQSLRFPEHPSTREELTDLARCWKDPNAPGPAHYNQRLPDFPRRAGKTFPFMSSQFHARPPPPFKVQPGPGRYDDDSKNVRYVNGHQSAFESKSRRSEWMVPEKFNSF